MSISRFVGCVMIVAGSAIGAGILAMPMVSAYVGFFGTAIAMVVLWALLTASGFLFVDLSCDLPVHSCTFDSMAKKTLGPFGRSITWVSCLLLLYSTLAAYIAGESSIVVNTLDSFLNFKMSAWFGAILITAILGAPVFFGVKVVDYINRILMGAKGVLLVLVIFFVMFYVDFNNLAFGNVGEKTKMIFPAIPVLVCVFNYHFIIPSLRIYVGDKKNELKWIVFSGTTFSLIIHLLWLFVMLGAVPLVGDDSFVTVDQNGGSVGEFIRVLTTIVKSNLAKISINSFANISITTSFLGVSLGLFDFLSDSFKLSNDLKGRSQTLALTFIPPLSFALFYPKGFVMALSYSAVFISILFLVLPAVMAYRMHKNNSASGACRSFFGRASFTIMIVMGSGFSIFPILNDLGFLGLFSNVFFF